MSFWISTNFLFKLEEAERERIKNFKEGERRKATEEIDKFREVHKKMLPLPVIK